MDSTNNYPTPSEQFKGHLPHSTREIAGLVERRRVAPLLDKISLNIAYISTIDIM